MYIYATPVKFLGLHVLSNDIISAKVIHTREGARGNREMNCMLDTYPTTISMRENEKYLLTRR